MEGMFALGQACMLSAANASHHASVVTANAHSRLVNCVVCVFGHVALHV